MSTSTLSSVAVHVVGQYNEAGKHLVGAYRSGALRAIGAVNGVATRYNEFLGKRELPLMSEQIKSGLVTAQEKVTGFLSERLARDTDFVAKAMDTVAERTTGGIQYLANAASRVESELGKSAITALSAVHMPAATISKLVADKVAEGARQIEVRVAGEQADAAEVVTTVKAKARRVIARKA